MNKYNPRRKKDYPPCDPENCANCTRPADMCHGGPKDYRRTPYKEQSTRPGTRPKKTDKPPQLCSGSRMGGPCHGPGLPYIKERANMRERMRRLAIKMAITVLVNILWRWRRPDVTDKDLGEGVFTVVLEMLAAKRRRANA